MATNRGSAADTVSSNVNKAATSEITVPPENLIGEFPEPVLSDFDPIKRAPYRNVNPMRFAKKFGRFNRQEILKNYELAKSLAMQELETELAGLDKYAPAAAALKRQEISRDNVFNQQQRTQQIESVMPNVDDWLASQADRANAYASGRVPDSIQDRMLELNTRSASADRSTAAGFGAQSSVARKASDLMSAEKRIQLSQYGDQLLTQNIGTTAGLMLAPTEYSQAGSEIRVMPEVGAARLAAGALSEINAQTTIPVSLGYQSRINQRQFVANLEQQTRAFNAQGKFSESQFNAQTQNSFALQKFGYQVSYAGVVAGAETANNYTMLGLQQQAQAQQIFQDYQSRTQSANEAGAVSQGAAALIPQIINGVSGMFSPNNSGTTGDGQINGPAVNSDGTANVMSPDYSADDIEFDAGGNPTIGGYPVSPPSGYEGGNGGYDTGGGSTVEVPSVESDTPIEFDYNAGLDSASSGTSYSSSSGEYMKTAPGLPGYSFQAATGLKYTPNMEASTNATLQTAGVAKDPTALGPTAVAIGTNFAGKPIFASPILADGQDINAGNSVASTLSGILSPFRAYTPEELASIDAIGAVASNPAVLNELSQWASSSNSKEFVNAALAKFNKGPVENLVGDRNGTVAAHTVYEASQFWNQLSPEQQSLVVAGVGLKAADFQGKKNLGEVIIPATVKPGTKPVTAAHALKWFSQGINAYPLTKKWDQFSVISKLATGKNDPDTVAAMAKQFNMLGAGENGAEVPGVTEAGLAKAGFTPAPHLGVGAIYTKSGGTLPQGYVQIASNGKEIVGAPKGTAYTSSGAVLKSASGSQAPVSRSPIIDWSMGAYNIYNMWSRKPGTGSIFGTTGIIARNVDAYNLAQARREAARTGGKVDPNSLTNYGQYAGAGISAYNAYQDIQRGNEVQGYAGLGQSGLLGAQAAYTSMGDTAAANAMGDYAGYAGATIGAYNAYEAFERGDKEGGAVATVQAGASLYHPGAGMAVAGAYQTYQGWGSGDTKNGVIGGSMMLAGMAMMGMPLIGVGLMAVAVVSNSIKTGKHKDQNARDTIREAWQANGFMVDKEYNVTLADGSLFNIGVDGGGGRHAFTDASQVSEARELNAYDTDYTNDLDYASSMGGVTLTRLLMGEKAKNIDQIGSQLGNAGIGNIGFNQDMTEENFNKMRDNMRGFYAKAGIGSKNDVYQLANAAFAEGRLSEADLMVAHQTANFLFDDDGYNQCKQLMAGRNNGVQVAQDVAAADNTDDNDRPTTEAVQESAAIPAAQQGTGPTEAEGVPSNITAPTIGGEGEQPRYLKGAIRLTKEQVQALNQSRYAAAGMGA